MKDFFDLWSLLGTLDLDGGVITRALRATLERRGTPLPTEAPIGLSTAFVSDLTKQAQWRAFLRRLRLADIDLGTVVERVRQFAVPVFGAARSTSAIDSRWSAAAHTWSS